MPVGGESLYEVALEIEDVNDSIAGCIHGVVAGLILHCVSHEHPTSYLLNVERRKARR